MAIHKELWRSFILQLEALVTTAFGLVAALAWNGAIQSLFKDFFGTATETGAMFVYAVVVTIIAVIAVYYVSKLNPKK